MRGDRKVGAKMAEWGPNGRMGDKWLREEERWPCRSVNDGGPGRGDMAGRGLGQRQGRWLPSAEGGSGRGETKWRRRPKPEACSCCHGNEA